MIAHKTFSYFLYSLIFCGLTISACSSSKSTSNPTRSSSNTSNWIENPASAFSEQKYLMAVGSGDTFDDARSRAMMNLTQIFRSTIESNQKLISDFNETTVNNGAFSSEETSRLLNTINISASEELMNTEVLRSEVSNDGRHYVLAGMDRAASTLIYERELANNEQKARELLNRASTTSAVLSSLAMLKNAVLLARVNENLVRQLSIINPGYPVSPTIARQLTESETAFSVQQQEAQVFIQSTGSPNGVVERAIQKTLQQQGFITTSEMAKSLIIAKYTYNAQEANLNRDDAKFVQWNVSIELNEKETQAEYGTFTRSGRDGALSLNDAFTRAALSAAKEIEQQFSDFITTNLFAK